MYVTHPGCCIDLYLRTFRAACMNPPIHREWFDDAIFVDLGFERPILTWRDNQRGYQNTPLRIQKDQQGLTHLAERPRVRDWHLDAI